MSAVRSEARDAVESLGMRPVMFETSPAADENSRRVLLDRIADCDAVVLLLGAQYGEGAARGMSPTEEEFDQATRAGIPVIALVQEGVDREPAQQRFVDRVRGSWESGRFAPGFTGAGDVALAVVRALNHWRSAAPSEAQAEAAQARLGALAQGVGRQASGGSKLRVVSVPIANARLLDDVALSSPNQLIEDLSALARSSHLISNAVGITGEVSANDDVRLQSTVQRGWEQLTLTVGADGAVLAEGPVGGQGQFFGTSIVLHDRVPEVIQRSLHFAQAVWQTIDRRDEVAQVFVAIAVPEAGQKIYALVEPGNQLSMGGYGRLPQVLVAPEPPLLVRRQDLLAPELTERLRAALQRRFQAAGAVHGG